MRRFTGFEKGVNLGGWLSQCKGKYNDEHYSTFIVESDIERIANDGLDHVRLPIDYNVIQNDDGSFIKERFRYIDNCIEWCAKRGLNIVLDIHKACGFVFDDKDYCGFFDSKELQDIFVKLWEELARRYGKKENVVFELLNEVTELRFADPWNKIARRTIEAIRKITADMRIIIGGIYNDSIYGLTLLDAPYDENIVFTFHFYNPVIFTHQKAEWVENMPPDIDVAYPQPVEALRKLSHEVLGDTFDSDYEGQEDGMIGEKYFIKMFEDAVKIAEKHNVPLYCGEYGVIDRTDVESTKNWFNDFHRAMRKYNIASSIWSYKEMDFGIIDEHYKEIYKSIISFGELD